MGNNNSYQKINFEDLQYGLNKPNYIIINTLKENEQNCLISGTTPICEEETIIKTSHEKIMMMKSDNNEHWYDVYRHALNIIESAKSYNMQVIAKEIDKYVQNYKPQKNYREENKKKSFSDN